MSGRGGGRGGGGRGGAGGGRGGGPVTCNYCKEVGHKIPECPKLKQKERAAAASSGTSQSRPPYSGSSGVTPQSQPQAPITATPKIDVQPVIVSRDKLKTKARHSYVKRPGIGTKGRIIELIANHFRLVIQDIDVFQYRIEIKPFRSRPPQQKPEASASGDTSAAKVRRLKQKEVREVFDYFVSTTPELFGKAPNYPVYDGDCIMITAKELLHKTFEKTVELEEYGSKYKINVLLTQTIDLSAINLYYDGKTTEVPRYAIQAIEIILKHGPTSNRVPIGNSLYPKDNPMRRKEFIDKNNVKHVSFGHYQSMHLAQVGPTLIVDRSATAFYIGGSLVDMVNKLSRNVFNDIGFLTKQLKGLRIYTKHLPYKRSYTIKAVHNKSPKDTFFELEEKTGQKRQISVYQYYKEQYKREVNAPLPCIIATGGRNNYLPLELCELFPDQPVFRGALTAENTATMVRKCGSQPPSDRFVEIYTAVSNIANDGKNYIKEFKIDVDRNPLLVPGRILDKPVIEPEIKGVNQARKLYKPMSLRNWIVVNLSPDTKDIFQEFVKTLCTSAAQAMGIQISPPFKNWTYDPYNSQQSIGNLIQVIFRGAFEEAKNAKVVLQMILFIIPFDGEIYTTIKLFGDIHHGIATQCVKSANVLRTPRGIHNNVLLKINAKLGGVNSIIKDLPDKPAILKERVMIIGADVTHPAPGSKLVSSVAACIGSYDKDHCCYAASIVVQERSAKVMQETPSASASGGSAEEPKQKAEEMIKKFDIMIKELLKFYHLNNKSYPTHIIYYRDGVSDSQFSQVLKWEYERLLKGCIELKVKPKVTFITVQKRHHTRYRPRKPEDGDKKGNILPGTTVDTHVTHPADFDFYLCSHEGIQGTSRPTHYYVLHDDNNFSADELQKLTYYLCYTYARCEKPISIPSPVQYAHLAAYRARNHIVACNIHAEKTKQESDEQRKQREIKLASVLNEKIKVNEALKNRMYYC